MRAIPEFPRFSAPRALTKGPKEHFFASYYAIDPWCRNGRYAIVLETEVRSRLPTENDPAVLGVVDCHAGNDFIPLTETRCWNFQEGTMAHWLGGGNAAEPGRFIFNDMVDGEFASVVFDLRDRSRRNLAIPISAVAPDGEWAVGINYARLRLTRPDYGYGGGGQDARIEEVWPANDGLRTLDLKSGEEKLIVSIASVQHLMPQPEEAESSLSYFCHTKISPGGAKIFWLARTAENYRDDKLRKWHTTAFVCNRDGGDVRRCFPDGWGGSHFDWLDDDRMVVTANYKNTLYTHVLFTVGDDDYLRLGKGLLDFDGHAVFSPDGLWMATDTYPNALNERGLCVMRMADQAILPLQSFFEPPTYRGIFWRCDFHPRWSADGKRLAFNAVFEGSRQAYVADLD